MQRCADQNGGKTNSFLFSLRDFKEYVAMRTSVSGWNGDNSALSRHYALPLCNERCKRQQWRLLMKKGDKVQSSETQSHKLCDSKRILPSTSNHRTVRNRMDSTEQEGKKMTPKAQELLAKIHGPCLPTNSAPEAVCAHNIKSY